MKRQLIFVGLVIVSIALYALPGWPQPPGRGMMQGQDPRGMMMPENAPGHGGEGMSINWQLLNLTQGQRQQIQQLRRKFQLDTVSIRQEIQFASQDLQAEIMKDTVDRAEIDELLNRISSLRQRLSEAAVQNLLDIRGIFSQEQTDRLVQSQQRIPGELQRLSLTPEQRTQIQELMDSTRNQTRAIFGELRDLREKLRELLLSSAVVDLEQLHQVQKMIAEKESALEKIRVDNILRMREILTPEQQEQFKQFRARIPQNNPARQK